VTALRVNPQKKNPLAGYVLQPRYVAKKTWVDKPGQGGSFAGPDSGGQERASIHCYNGNFAVDVPLTVAHGPDATRRWCTAPSIR
jgi:hypothetical protein